MKVGLFSQILLSWSASSVESWLPMDATSLNKVPFKRSTQAKINLKMSPHSLYVENHVVFICLLSVSPSRSYVFLEQELMNPSTLPDAKEAQTSLDDGWVHKLISWRVNERNLGGCKEKIEYLCICRENSALVPTCIYPRRIREQISQWPEWWIWIQIWMGPQSKSMRNNYLLRKVNQVNEVHINPQHSKGKEHDWHIETRPHIVGRIKFIHSFMRQIFFETQRFGSQWIRQPETMPSYRVKQEKEVNKMFPGWMLLQDAESYESWAGFLS